MAQNESDGAETPLVNVLTRTSGRPNFFARCRSSVLEQTYPRIRQIVAVDDPASKAYLSGVEHVEMRRQPRRFWKRRLYRTTPLYHAPYNLYLNALLDRVESGYVIYLDDDDIFHSKTAVERIMARVRSRDQLALWKVQLPSRVVPEPKYFGAAPRITHISGIGFMFHKQYAAAARWDEFSCGDFRVATSLYAAVPDKVWIDEVLTAVQRADEGGLGRRDDLTTSP